MKTRMTITVDKDVKDKFQQIAKNLWSNTSTLTNMFFVSVINTWSVNYYDNIDNYW
jgi:antitoxin component of RelBE/YafQ-DinJ toxin-antitoxin module